MSYNVNCITCQIVGKGPIKSGNNKKGIPYKSQVIELKVPRQNPTENPRTGYDYVKMNAQTDVVDFILRSFKNAEGKEFESRNAVLVTPANV